MRGALILDKFGGPYMGHQIKFGGPYKLKKKLFPRTFKRNIEMKVDKKRMFDKLKSRNVLKK